MRFLAEAGGIPWQTMRSVAGRTDTAAIQRTKEGVRTAAVSIPCLLYTSLPRNSRTKRCAVWPPPATVWRKSVWSCAITAVSYTHLGEQSGHTIFRRYATTGDGQLTALQFLDLLCRSGKKASELVGECKRYPQVLINVPVADKAKKEAVLSAPALQSAVAEQEEKLAGNGRVLVRPSGTEALIRVLVEAQTEPVARETAELLAKVIKNHGS